MARFSIIMQCYLGQYQNAASNRPAKLLRAVDSVLAQKFKDWELIIIADGCQETFDIICDKYSEHENIDCRLIQKQQIWGGGCRNYGIKQAKGEIIIYLDADDFYGVNHLQIVSDEFKENDWVFYNDIVNFKDSPQERKCLIRQKFQHGTSNIAHKRSLNATWTSWGYGLDDWGLVQHLLKLTNNYTQIKTPEYYVCHLLKQLDV